MWSHCGCRDNIPQKNAQNQAYYSLSGHLDGNLIQPEFNQEKLFKNK
jgi:hypothetical protein